MTYKLDQIILREFTIFITRAHSRERRPLNFQYLLLLRSLYIRNAVCVIFIMQTHYRRFDVTPC